MIDETLQVNGDLMMFILVSGFDELAECVACNV
jgi:hypothetical protein